jgi:uncharacterized protein
VADPPITFYHVVMRPQWGPLESGRAAIVWPDARPRFLAQVAGPHFEQLCRDHALNAPVGTYAALPGEVGAGVVSDPARRRAIEVDIVVLGSARPGEPGQVLCLGLAKLGDVMGLRHLERLRRARDLLAARGHNTRDTVLACYGGAGYEPGLAAGSSAERVILIGPDELYANPAAGGGRDGLR